MGAKWAVTVAAERLVLDQERQGEVVFSVTNGGDFDDAVAVLVEPEGDGQASWFAVDDPQRDVGRGATATFPVRVEVPADAPAGEYAVRLRCYSADSAPEEDPALSPVVVVQVPEPPAEAPKRRPWWLLVVAALVVVVLVVVLALVFSGGDDDPDAGQPIGAEVVMPDLVGLTEREALAELAQVGLTARPSRYLHDPVNADRVVQQSVSAGSVVSTLALVDLQVGVALAAPTVIAPAGVAVVGPDEPMPVLQWTPGPVYQRQWLITIEAETCERVTKNDWGYDYLKDSQVACEFTLAPGGGYINVPRFTPEFERDQLVRWVLTDSTGLDGVWETNRYRTGWVRWRVAAVDDFGTPGPASEYSVFRVDMWRRSL